MAAAAAAARLKLKRSTPGDPPPLKKQAVEPERVGFEPGESVLGNFKALGDWDEAIVVGVHTDGSYTLEYTDEGLIEENVPPSCVRPATGDAAAEGGGALPAEDEAALAELFRLNESCMADFRGFGDWDEASWSA